MFTYDIIHHQILKYKLFKTLNMENNITVNDVDTDFLPLIHDIIKR